MSEKMKIVLTAMIAVVITALVVVSLFLAWDEFGLHEKLDELFETELYARELVPESDTAVNITFDGKMITEEEETLFRSWFTFIYAGLGAGKAENLSSFYTHQCVYELYDEFAYGHGIYAENLSALDLTFKECSLTIDVKRRHSVSKSERIEIDMELSAEVSCSYGGKPAVIRGEKHSFVLEEDGRTPLIYEHTTDSPASRAALYVLDEVLADSGFVRSNVTYTLYSKYLAAAKERLTAAGNSFALETAPAFIYPDAEIPYDRDTAANAAMDGVSRSSPFGEYEENDANFLSSCIFQAGIPMDSQGEAYDQWKWYDAEVNTERRKTGCSKSWYDREAFCNYINANYGFGMAACETAAGNGELGDIIQLLENGRPVLEFMITGIAADADGQVKDYLVSNDKYANISLLAAGFYDIRVLHIVGHNTANI